MEGGGNYQEQPKDLALMQAKDFVADLKAGILDGTISAGDSYEIHQKIERLEELRKLTKEETQKAIENLQLDIQLTMFNSLKNGITLTSGSQLLNIITASGLDLKAISETTKTEIDETLKIAGSELKIKLEGNKIILIDKSLPTSTLDPTRILSSIASIPSEIGKRYDSLATSTGKEYDRFITRAGNGSLKLAESLGNTILIKAKEGKEILAQEKADEKQASTKINFDQIYNPEYLTSLGINNKGIKLTQGDDGLVYLTAPDGKHFTKFTPNGAGNEKYSTADGLKELIAKKERDWKLNSNVASTGKPKHMG